MKVLYIGCYRDGTGWAHAAQGYILSLDAVGIEVVPRFIKLNESYHEIPERIQELEQNNDSDCDAVIQHVLPHHLDFNGSFDRNIALYVTETNHCNNTCWPERINLMDEAWVPNRFMAKEVSKNSNIFTPHQIVPHAADISKYQKEYQPLEIPALDNKFVFYYIGECNRRKNIGTLLKAFHLEFGPEEDVAIVLKAHIPEQSAEESEYHLKDLSNKVKDGLKLYPSLDLYHNEIFVCGYLPEEQIMRLHATCDCFVSASLGEAWGIPVFDAMAMGKTPICTDTGGPSDFLKRGGYLIESKKEPCFGMIETFSELYVANEMWDVPSIEGLRSSMRKAFEDKNDRMSKSSFGVEDSYEYSYYNVGKKMQSILEGESEPYKQNKDVREKHQIGSMLK